MGVVVTGRQMLGETDPVRMLILEMTTGCLFATFSINYSRLLLSLFSYRQPRSLAPSVETSAFILAGKVLWPLSLKNVFQHMAVVVFPAAYTDQLSRYEFVSLDT